VTTYDKPPTDITVHIHDYLCTIAINHSLTATSRTRL